MIIKKITNAEPIKMLGSDSFVFGIRMTNSASKKRHNPKSKRKNINKLVPQKPGGTFINEFKISKANVTILRIK
jgi:hypothetical protein